MKLSEHFDTDIDTRFLCRCCGKFIHNQHLIDELEHIRSIWGKPVEIVSGTRCQKYNATLPGAAPNSKHLTGEAVDIKIEDIDPYDVYHELCKRYPDWTGLGQYHTFTHFDIRPQKARW